MSDDEIDQFYDWLNSVNIDLIDEAEEDENNGVKWKHSRLKAKLVEYRHYMYQHYATGDCQKRDELH